MSWQLIKGDMRLSYLALLWGFHTITHAKFVGAAYDAISLAHVDSL
jgi:hypothetical protein